MPSATERSSVSLLVIPSSLASSWRRIFAGKVAVSLSDGDGDQFTCAPADRAVQRGASFSHVRRDFQWSYEERLQPSVGLWTEGPAQRPSECVPLRRLGQACGAVRAQPRSPSGERAPDHDLARGVRDNPDQVVCRPLPPTPDAGADRPGVSSRQPKAPPWPPRRVPGPRREPVRRLRSTVRRRRPR